MQPLPAAIETNRLLLRHWEEADADDLAVAIEESIEQLRPWMPWALHEPLGREERTRLFREWRDTWADGSDTVLGMFRGSRVVGGTGLHRRGGPNELEIGYWVRSGETGQGFATETSRALTSVAFERRDVEIVSIHHDRENRASAAIPRKLGFRMVRELEYEAVTPGCCGIEWQWEMSRDRWAHLVDPGT